MLISLAEELDTSVSVLLGEDVAEPSPDDELNLKSISEWLEAINLQLAKRTTMRIRIIRWLLILLGVGIMSIFICLATMGSEYLNWDFNDPELAAMVTEVAGSLPSCERVVQHKKLGCSEDFTMLATRVKAAGGKSEFFVVGADRTAAHHQREFDFDEKGLETAFGIFKGCVMKLNGI